MLLWKGASIDRGVEAAGSCEGDLAPLDHPQSHRLPLRYAAAHRGPGLQSRHTATGDPNWPKREGLHVHCQSSCTRMGGPRHSGGSNFQPPQPPASRCSFHPELPDRQSSGTVPGPRCKTSHRRFRLHATIRMGSKTGTHLTEEPSQTVLQLSARLLDPTPFLISYALL
jgi:hypothetical protein